jgi:hypothetical protein
LVFTALRTVRIRQAYAEGNAILRQKAVNAEAFLFSPPHRTKNATGKSHCGLLPVATALSPFRKEHPQKPPWSEKDVRSGKALEGLF